MRPLGPRPFPVSPLVPPPPRLHLFFSCLGSISSLPLAVLLLVTIVAAAMDTPASPAPHLQNKNSPHIVVQFPSINNPRNTFFPLDPNNTREGALRFSHLTVDPKTNRLYAGAVNRLMQLNSDLELEALVSTGKKLCLQNKNWVLLTLDFN